MPRFEWRDEDMRYSMAVFPWVGAVIGVLYYGVYLAARRFSMPDIAAALLMTAVPVLLTGGFHIDGFMDVSDAVSSFRPREEKIRILKDPHIGAFAVIRLALAGMIYLASLLIVIDGDDTGSAVLALSIGFFLARALSALAVLTFRSAKNDGMLYYEATSAASARTANLIMTAVWIVLAAFAMDYAAGLRGGFAAIGAAVSFLWYKLLSYREFGGITGDTAGWFVVVCETMTAASAALAVLAL